MSTYQCASKTGAARMQGFDGAVQRKFHVLPKSAGVHWDVLCIPHMHTTAECAHYCPCSLFSTWTQILVFIGISYKGSGVNAR